MYKGDKIELKAFSELKQRQLKGILFNITQDSISILDKKKGVISMSKQSVFTITLPKSGANAKKIIAVTVLLIGAAILLLFVFFWLITGVLSTSKMRMNNEKKAGNGCLLIFLGLLATVGVFFANRDREIKQPFNGDWKIEGSSIVNKP